MKTVFSLLFIAEYDAEGIISRNSSTGRNLDRFFIIILRGCLLLVFRTAYFVFRSYYIFK